jgi:TorA maturation chaperone TorD
VTGDSADEILARVAADRAAVYAALSRGFYLPDDSLVWEVREGSFVQGIEAAVTWLGPDSAAYRPHLDDLHAVGLALRARQADDVLRELKVEHARLFTGPGRPAVGVFESEYVDLDGDTRGRLDGPATAAVARWYRAAGFERAASHRDLPDHVATELEFLHALARNETDARRTGDPDLASRLRRDTDSFLREHPARWMPAFCRATLEARPHAFYAGLVGVLEIHLSIELGETFERTTLPFSRGAAPGADRTV